LDKLSEESLIILKSFSHPQLDNYIEPFKNIKLCEQYFKFFNSLFDQGTNEKVIKKMLDPNDPFIQ